MDFQSMIEQRLEPVGRSGNDIIYLCPQCDDKSGHLYINYDKGYYHCFKCNLSGKRLESLLKKLHIDIDYDYTKLYNEQDKELDSIIAIKEDKKKSMRVEKVVDYSTNLDVLTEYYYQHTKPLTRASFEYLLSRRIFPYNIEKLGMREGVNRYGDIININGKDYIGRDYSGRIMVPSLRRDGRISFYVGRDYIGDKPAKYMNCSTEIAVASEDVWNLDIVDSETVIICEGVFTAIAVNQALNKTIAVATYGKSIAQKSNSGGLRVTSQGDKLIRRGFKRYIVFYDKDALQSTLDTCDYLYNRGCNVNVVVIPPDWYGPKADAADMTAEEVISCVVNSLPYDRLSRTLLLGGNL